MKSETAVSRRSTSFVVSVALAALGFVLIVYTLSQPWGRIGSGDALGAGFFPLLTLTGLVVFGLLSAFRTGRGSPEVLKLQTFSLRVVLLVIISWIFGYGVDHYGMLVSTPPYLAVSLWVWGARSWVRIILVVVTVTAALFLFYVKLFNRIPG